MRSRDVIRAFVSGSLFLFLLTGCAGSPQNSSALAGSESSSDKMVAEQSQLTWETQIYEDAYLSYEIPANWQKCENSSDELRLTLFTPRE